MVTAVERSALADATGSLHGFHNALTSFVGRAQVVDEVAAELGQYRLVTVTGPGGAGKTRLAGEVARQVAGRFADGVWLAELAAVTDPAQVTAMVGTALGIRDLPSVAAADALAQTLARRQLLLVLDNCEHVIGAAAELCGRLLLGADDVRVLATSREPLRIAGEVRHRLGPLTLPHPGDPAAAGQCEAVMLFADRARRVEPGFALDEKTAATVVRLVARLDGMPLAIELAAARVDALGAAQLLDRIDDRFALLADGDRLAEERQRSLAAAVRWSYQLLDGTERRVFRAVSVFPGPFTLGGAEAVAGAGANLCGVLWHLMIVDLRAGRTSEAAAHLRELLQIATQTGVRPLIHAGLDCCGHLCAATGRPAEAVTAWAAMSALAGPWPVLRGGLNPARRDALRRQAQALLGPARARAAEERGAAMSLATATEYALLLAAEPQPPAVDIAAGHQPAVDAAAGLARLSPRERELVTLVGRGRTDTQIAAQLYITVRTVSSHLDRIRDKTGCRRRADLTRLALSAGLV